MANPPSRRHVLSHIATLFGILCFFVFASSFVYAKDQKTARFKNNKTFYAKEAPELKAPSTLIAMRHTPSYEPVSMAFDVIKAKKLAEIAKKDAPFKKTRRRCMRFVRKAIAKLMGNKALDLNSLPSDPIPAKAKMNHALAGRSSVDFMKWALNNPVSLCKNLKLANVSEYPDHISHDGDILLYKGKCGFNRRYGHAEILTNAKAGEACSDHCRKVSDSCKPDLVLATVAHCDWIHEKKTKEKEFDNTPHIKQKPMFLTKNVEVRPPAN